MHSTYHPVQLTYSAVVEVILLREAHFPKPYFELKRTTKVSTQVTGFLHLLLPFVTKAPPPQILPCLYYGLRQRVHHGIQQAVNV